MVEPLAPGRSMVKFTASTAFCEKLACLRELMRSSVPDGDLAQVLEAAVTEALERREARRFGRAKKPRKTLAQADTSASGSRYLPAAVRRAAHEAADGRCRFVGPDGRRCGSKVRLEFHHGIPWAHGSDRSPANIRLLCRTHNGYLAEADCGPAVMARFRHARRGGEGSREGSP